MKALRPSCLLHRTNAARRLPRRIEPVATPSRPGKQSCSSALLFSSCASRRKASASFAPSKRITVSEESDCGALPTVYPIIRARTGRRLSPLDTGRTPADVHRRCDILGIKHYPRQGSSLSLAAVGGRDGLHEHRLPGLEQSSLHKSVALAKEWVVRRRDEASSRARRYPHKPFAVLLRLEALKRPDLTWPAAARPRIHHRNLGSLRPLLPQVSKRLTTVFRVHEDHRVRCHAEHTPLGWLQRSRTTDLARFLELRVQAGHHSQRTDVAQSTEHLRDARPVHSKSLEDPVSCAERKDEALCDGISSYHLDNVERLRAIRFAEHGVRVPLEVRIHPLEEVLEQERHQLPRELKPLVAVVVAIVELLRILVRFEHPAHQLADVHVLAPEIEP
eukprot:scaffold641_cov237-Pinguiococcus_pyrenoidosus.AAC.16